MQVLTHVIIRSLQCTCQSLRVLVLYFVPSLQLFPEEGPACWGLPCPRKWNPLCRSQNTRACWQEWRAMQALRQAAWQFFQSEAQHDRTIQPLSWESSQENRQPKMKTVRVQQQMNAQMKWGVYTQRNIFSHKKGRISGTRGMLGVSYQVPQTEWLKQKFISYSCGG